MRSDPKVEAVATACSSASLVVHCGSQESIPPPSSLAVLLVHPSSAMYDLQEAFILPGASESRSHLLSSPERGLGVVQLRGSVMNQWVLDFINRTYLSYCDEWTVSPGFLICVKTSAREAKFACFLGHYASVKTPDLHHKRCHLYLSHLDHGYILLTPTCYLPETIYLQVQVRLTSGEQRGDSEDLDRGMRILSESQTEQYLPHWTIFSASPPSCCFQVCDYLLHFFLLFLFSSQQL